MNGKHRTNGYMKTLQLDDELYYAMSEIAEDEVLMTKVLKYVKRLAAKKRNNPTEMTKEEFFRHVSEAEAQYARGEFVTQKPGESLSDMIKRSGYVI